MFSPYISTKPQNECTTPGTPVAQSLDTTFFYPPYPIGLSLCTELHTLNPTCTSRFPLLLAFLFFPTNGANVSLVRASLTQFPTLLCPGLAGGTRRAVGGVRVLCSLRKKLGFCNARGSGMGFCGHGGRAMIDVGFTFHRGRREGCGRAAKTGAFRANHRAEREKGSVFKGLMILVVWTLGIISPVPYVTSDEHGRSQTAEKSPSTYLARN